MVLDATTGKLVALARRYDELQRYNWAANDQFNIAQPNDVLLSTLTQMVNHQLRDEVRGYMSGRPSSTTDPSGKTSRKPACGYFNRDGVCVKDALCDWPHVCNKCGGADHGANACKMAGAAKP